jgi:hypothetical protein
MYRLEAADGFAAGFAFGDAAGEVVAGASVPAQPRQSYAVKRRIGLSIAAAVQPATAGLARGCFQGVDAAQRGEGCLAAQSGGIVAGGDEQGGGVVGTDAAAGQQRRAVRGDRVGDPVDQVVDFLGQLKDAPDQPRRRSSHSDQALRRYTPILTVAFADGGLRQAVLMRRRHSRLPAPRSSFAGFRFPPDVTTVAVRWYLRYGLSYRDVEELLAERGIEVDYVTIYR